MRRFDLVGALKLGHYRRSSSLYWPCSSTPHRRLSSSSSSSSSSSNRLSPTLPWVRKVCPNRRKITRMPLFNIHEFKNQVSFLLREKMKNARLVLTDVSRIQLLTEEATNADPWGPETRSLAMLSDAAFELEEFERIVQVLQSRLDPNVKRPWRQSYKILIVLEYLFTHGPASLAHEFMADTSCIEELCQYQFIDQKGVDRGISVRNKADQVLELLRKADHWKEERNRAQKISHGICGFGSTIEEAPLDVETHEIQAITTSELVHGENELLLPSNMGCQQASASPSCELKPFEKYISYSWRGDDGGGRSSANHGSISESRIHDQSNCFVYTKSLSSPSHFRDTSQVSLHALANDASKENHPEHENKEVSGDSILSQGRRGGETSPLLDQSSGETDKVAAPANFSLRHLCGIHRAIKECPCKDGAVSSSKLSHPKEVSNVEPEGEDMADAKKQTKEAGNTSKLPLLPPPPRPKFRARFQHHFQSSSLMDL